MSTAIGMWIATALGVMAIARIEVARDARERRALVRKLERIKREEVTR